MHYRRCNRRGPGFMPAPRQKERPMPDILPLFPLQAVIFPGEQMRLHIFEPRYRQLIAECETEGITFGIPCYLKAGLAEIGTEMRLVQVFRRYDSGESDVLVEGTGAFQLLRFLKELPDKLYSAAEVTRIEDRPEPPLPAAARTRVHALHTSLREALGLEPMAPSVYDTEVLSYRLAQEMGLTLAQKLQLLAVRSESARLDFLIEHMEEVIPVLEAAEETRRRVRGNGHFHKFPELEL